MSSFLFQCLCLPCISERFFFLLAKNLLKSICKRNQTHLRPPRSAGRLWGLHNRPSVCRGPDRSLLNGRSTVCLWDFELWRPRLASSQPLGPASVGSRTDADREGVAMVTPETHREHKRRVGVKTSPGAATGRGAGRRGGNRAVQRAFHEPWRSCVYRVGNSSETDHLAFPTFGGGARVSGSGEAKVVGRMGNPREACLGRNPRTAVEGSAKAPLSADKL